MTHGDKTDWEKALWMITEGFTPEQLMQLDPSDADAWLRLRPMLHTRKANWKEERRNQVLTEMLDAFDKCEPIDHGHDRKDALYLTDSVCKAHIKSKPTFYLHLKQLGLKPTNIGGRSWLRYPVEKDTPSKRESDVPSEQDAKSSACHGVNNQGEPCGKKGKNIRDDCELEEKIFCWMHCPCDSCSQSGKHATHYSVKNRGVLYREVSE